MYCRQQLLTVSHALSIIGLLIKLSLIYKHVLLKAFTSENWL